VAQPGLHTFPTAAAEQAYIRARATQLGLDPEAVLAVAAHEGVSLPSEIGDQGTSFGPWQLHQGGRLPSQIYQQGAGYAQAWANSQEGIDYALNGIAGVARGMRGPQAVATIVTQFEQPLHPAPEIAGAVQTYNAQGGPSLVPGQQGKAGTYPPHSGPGIGPFIGSIPGLGEIPSIPGVHIPNPLAPFTAAEKAYDFLTSWRFVELVGGFLLLLAGLYLLAKQFGATALVPGPAGAATKAAAGPVEEAASSQAGTEAAYRRGEQQGREARARSLGRQRASRSLETKANTRRRANTETRTSRARQAAAVDYGEVPF
jgi:hypothetical protein